MIVRKFVAFKRVDVILVFGFGNYALRIVVRIITAAKKSSTGIAKTKNSKSSEIISL